MEVGGVGGEGGGCGGGEDGERVVVEFFNHERGAGVFLSLSAGVGDVYCFGFGHLTVESEGARTVQLLSSEKLEPSDELLEGGDLLVGDGFAGGEGGVEEGEEDPLQQD